MRNEIKKGFTLIELPVVRKRAFTLIELLVVIAIIGILATVVILNVASARVKAQNAKIKADIATVAKAVDIHLAFQSTLPTGIPTSPSFQPLNNANIVLFVDDSNQSILSKAPVHPGGMQNCTGTNYNKSYCIYRWSSNIIYIYFATKQPDALRMCWWQVSPALKSCNLNF